VEEAAEAGITEMIFITGRTKRAIEDHFDKAYELEVELEMRGRQQLLDELRSMLPRSINCIYMRQSEALGLGHAVLCARPIVGDEPFAVILADDFIDGKPGAMKQMLERYCEYGSSILGVENVDPSETASYGIVDAADIAPSILQVNGIVEKPRPEEAPSNLAVVGRYLFTPRIFEHLETVQPGKGGEIQLTDGIASLMREERVLAYRFEGKRYDCGSKLGYMKANVELAMRHPAIGAEFSAYLKQFKA
jgi:UTP--glucose-1-phosphate uridylyltransferase